MTDRRNVVTGKILIRCIAKITLVLGLLMFSAPPGPGFKSVAPTLTKTELIESRVWHSKKTVSFKKVCNKYPDSVPQAFGLASNFNSFLWQYDNSLRVRFRVNLKIPTIIKDRGKTFHSYLYLNDSRSESDDDNSRG